MTSTDILFTIISSDGILITSSTMVLTCDNMIYILHK